MMAWKKARWGLVATAALVVACSNKGGTSTSGGGGHGTGGSAPLSVMTDHGQVQGIATGTTRAFLGIPYAAPPVGTLRWKPPADHAPWSSPLQANAKGPECPQLDPITMKFADISNEDCLTLNVWAPKKPTSAKLPVMVWIHGGAYVLGSGGDPAYDGQLLSEATGLIVVSINYRLGPLGFLALADLESEDPAHMSTGDYGFEDQRAALAWVKANAAAFGGDPANITAFGESAGGASVCQHLASPKSRGLFQRAIIESGPCDLVVAKAAAETQGQKLATALSCTGTGAALLSCLRGKSASDILAALPQSKDFIGPDGAKWLPVVDGLNFPDKPANIIAAGGGETMPTILGTNSDEGSLFFVLGGISVPDDATFVMLSEQLFPGHGSDIASHYPSAMYGSAQKAAIAAVTDGGFACPTRRAARAFAKAGSPTFLYHFTYAPTGGLLGDLGSFHSSEIRYVLGNPSQLLPQPLTDDEKALTATFMGYWSRHATSGDPNGAKATMWPKYDATGDANIVLDMTVSTETGYRKATCDYWDTLPTP